MDNDLEENLSNIEEEEEDEELDEETKRILWEANLKRLNNDSLLDFTDETKKSKSKSKKSSDNKNKKVILSLEELNKKIEPKKFVSKRVEEKKKINNEENLIKRTFNARLPPYNWVHQPKKEEVAININDEQEFPSL